MRIRIRNLLAIVLILFVFFKMTSCLRLRDSPQKVQKIFGEAQMKVQSKSIKSGERKLTFIHTNYGDSSKPLIIFVHGSPGASNNFNNNLLDTNLRVHFEMISVDRPGYGFADFGKSMPNLKSQAAYLSALVDSFSSRKIILVGHSYGGPLIVRLAMDYPEKISALMIVAGSVDPSLEPENWWRKPADSWFGRLITPKIFEVSNEEILTLKEDLEVMKPLWGQIQIPVYILQGEDDKLVPPGNAKFAQNQLVNSKWVQLKMVKDMNHFFPFTRHEFITKGLIELKEQI